MMQHERVDPTIARFYWRAVENRAKSREAGRPVFDQLEYVDIMIPGDSRTRLDRMVTDVDRARWKEQYLKFKGGATPEQQEGGTPLNEWPLATAARIAELNAQNVFTVEQLANVADHLLARLGMGAREMQLKAQEWLALGDDVGRPVEKIMTLRQQTSAQETRIAELEQQLRDIAGEMGRYQRIAHEAARKNKELVDLLARAGIPASDTQIVLSPTMGADVTSFDDADALDEILGVRGEDDPLAGMDRTNVVRSEPRRGRGRPRADRSADA